VFAVAPGVIVHELGHLALCRLSGVPVGRVVLFRIGSPAGFVTHAAPRLLRQHLAISVGPLAVSSVFAVALFLCVARLMATRPGAWWPAAAVLGLWPALSIASEAWPSTADADALRRSAGGQLRQLNVAALLALPLCWMVLAVNASRRLGGNWVYAGFLAAAALHLSR
jgi:hypothetical protein